ncbi:hypothetical protein [Cardinium endosymbiont of Culicoides punctatus]|uniref:hypothetical protein n=1 Tax=Cardinium endosymbiont of Culicoides punctatus TaxID=2304601 RepID=UPI001058B847|nr:hypothetical protein [Cardinium endosymbiont of Culicoides punctatus]
MEISQNNSERVTVYIIKICGKPLPSEIIRDSLRSACHTLELAVVSVLLTYMYTSELLTIDIPLLLVLLRKKLKQLKRLKIDTADSEETSSFFPSDSESIELTPSLTIKQVLLLSPFFMPCISAKLPVQLVPCTKIIGGGTNI